SPTRSPAGPRRATSSPIDATTRAPSSSRSRHAARRLISRPETAALCRSQALPSTQPHRALPHTCIEKLARNFLAAVLLASTRLWARFQESTPQTMEIQRDVVLLRIFFGEDDRSGDSWLHEAIMLK